jgi:hypothetical protein
MNPEIARDRSPRSPNIPLEDAVQLCKQLHHQARTAAIKPDIAVKALGYSSSNGSAMTALATLGQYGLVDRANGAVSVTPLALKILFPTSPEQLRTALKEAAYAPKVFNELLVGFEECSSEVIYGHLVQNEFTPERARKVAQVYLANRNFIGPLEVTASDNEEVRQIREPDTAGSAKNYIASIAPEIDHANSSRLSQLRRETAPTQSDEHQIKREFPMQSLSDAACSTKPVVARYTIPIGDNEATLIVHGHSMSLEDFDALIEYIDLFKRQFSRRNENQDVNFKPSN